MSELNYTPKDVAGKLAKGFLNNPITPVLAFFLLAIGYIALIITPREEDPQINVAGGSIIVALPGASAQEVREVVVKPLERAIKEISGVEHIYGVAKDSVGMVNVMYYIGENKEISDLKLYDKVMQNRDIYPEGIMPPIVKPIDVNTIIPVLSVAFYSKDGSLSTTELTSKVKDIQYRLNALPDVAVTELKGEKQEQFNIEVDMNKLAVYNLSLGQISMALKALAYRAPEVTSDTKEGQFTVLGLKDAIEGVNDIKKVIVASYRGVPVYLGDVAKVSLGEPVQNFKSAYIDEKNGELPQVTLALSKIKGSNAVTVVERVLEELEELKPSLNQNGVYYTVTRDYGERANHAVNELVFHLVISIVIIAILLVFALGWKESLIVTFTVPAILAVTLFIAYLTDQSINRITLFALILSLGLLVDAAIIVIENIHRHLHEHDAYEKSMDEILVEATDEIGSPTNIATFAIILTMVPMGFVGQMMGEFMAPIPANVPVALIASLFVAYIFTPYLSKKLLKHPERRHHHAHDMQMRREAREGE
jgi:multidrug efflux pump subunit AcrB